MLKVKELRKNQYIISDYSRAFDLTLFQSHDKAVISLDRKNLVITVYPDGFNSSISRFRNEFLRLEGFYEIDTTEKLFKAVKSEKVLINETVFKVVKIDRFSRGF